MSGELGTALFGLVGRNTAAPVLMVADQCAKHLGRRRLHQQL
jgi:hypothetical protein